MGVSPTDGEDFANELRRTYAQAERDTIKLLADELGTGTYREDWANIKLRQLAKLRGKIKTDVLDKLQVEDKVRNAIESAYRNGSDEAIADLKALKDKGANIDNVDPTFGKMNERAIKSLARETVAGLTDTHLRMLRQTEDVYRSAVSEASQSVLTGTATRREASQKVLDKFANKGVTGFVDNAGRSWSLSSYSEMAVRTTTGRASVNGHLDRMTRNGRDLVIVSAHADCCSLCATWQGRVFSISGRSPGYPPLDDAISGGLFHPNCRHSVNAYIKGLTRKPDVVQDQGAYEARMEQRYNERHIRKWKRRKVAAMDEKAENKAQHKITDWQARQKQHVANNDLKRLYYREQIDEAH